MKRPVRAGAFFAGAPNCIGLSLLGRAGRRLTGLAPDETIAAAYLKGEMSDDYA